MVIGNNVTDRPQQTIGEYINDESINKDGIVPNYFSKESMPKARPLTSNTGSKS